MTIDPKRVKEIFLEAAELPDEAARAAHLDKACGGDAGLRARVEALLRSHDPEGSFLGTPAAVAPEPDPAATEALTGNSDPVMAVTRTAAGENVASDDEPLTFLSPSTRPDSLGRIGHYEVLQILGRGGFGIVFRAFDETLQRVVALKVMAPQLAATSPARKRFLREARSSAQVRHENVVQVYEIGEQPLPYLAMEFIPGETLQQKLNRVGPLDVPEVLRIGRQIAEGLAAAHATDLIHRDIKPGNVLLEGGQQKVKITDFGLARTADDASISQSGIIAGTPMYMAPEQAKGETLDQRADLFSLGSVLYQMAAGRPPFRANTTVAVLKRVAEDKPRAIREIIPETPQWLCDIIAKLHAKDPNDRYQSARDVADVLADCEAQLKANAKVKDFSRIPRGKPRRSGRRKWVVAAALVLLGLMGIGVAVWKLPGSNPPPGRTDPPADPARANDLRLAADSPTDLIPFARPDLSSGRWESRDGKLVHPARDSQGYPGLTLAVRGPDDFDLEAEFERTSGDDFIAFGMTSRGHLFCVALDTWGQWAGLQAVAGELSNANPTRREGPWLTTGRRHTFRCEVRASGVRAWLDAREVVDYRGGYEALSYGRPGLPGWAQFFVQANDTCGFVVHKLVLIPRPPGVVPITDADPALAAEQQVEEVRKELMRRNPGFDGKLEHKIEDGVVTEIRVVTDNVTDISPLRVFNALRRLNCSGTSTNAPNGLLTDLTPLEGMNLAGLTHLDLSNTKMTDAGLAQFEGCKNLTGLNLYGAKVSDAGLAHFKDCKNLGNLFLAHTQVSDTGLAYFKDCKDLTVLSIDDTKVTDLSLLKGMPLKELYCDFQPERDAEILRSIRTLEKINGKPAAEFWKEADEGKAGVTPFTDADAQRIAALPAEQQVEEVRKELKRRNPGFDGKVETKIEDGVVTEFRIVTDKVTDIAPIRVFDALRVLECSGTYTDKSNGLLADLTPLAGMNLAGLRDLNLVNTKVNDAGMVCFKDSKNLTALTFGNTPVSDAGLANFKECKALTYLALGNTPVSDAGLANFKGMRLRELYIDNTGITDLTPLQGMPLEKILLTPKNITRGLDILRDMKSLKTIGIGWNRAWPAVEFWERYDRGEFK